MSGFIRGSVVKAGTQYGVSTQTFKGGEFDRVWVCENLEEAEFELAREEFQGRPAKLISREISEWAEVPAAAGADDDEA